jgi:hypothetical protein
VVAPSLTAHPRPRTGRGYLSAVSLVFHRPQSAGELLDVSLGVVKGPRALPESSALGLLMLPLSFVVYSIGEANEGYNVEDLFPAATEAAG